MRNIIAICIVFFCLENNLLSQDVIVLKNGDEIKSKVLEISPSEIKYKKFDNTDGPTITIFKSDVFMVKYSNGTKDIMKTENSAQNQPQPQPTSANPKAEKVKGQIKLEIGPQINGSMGTDFSSGVGIIADAKFMVTNSISVGFAVGYQHLFMASGWQERWYQQWSLYYFDPNYNIIPIRVTCNYYFGNGNIKPYLGGELGITKLYGHYSYNDAYYGHLSDDWTETHFALAPQAGFEIGGKVIALDFNIKYNGFDLGYLSGKIGIVINIGGGK